MQLTVNGEPLDYPDRLTVTQLIQQRGLAGKAVAVELNREVVPRAEHDSTVLREGDTVELVTLVGGG